MQFITNLRQKIQEHQTLSLIILTIVLIIIVILPFIPNNPPTEPNLTPETKYDPISHEVYYETIDTENESNLEPEHDFEGTTDLQLLGFSAISTTTRNDLYQDLLQDLDEYTKKTFTDEEITYVSLYEDSLTYNNKSADYFSMSFRIYFNGAHPTDVTFQTYPKVKTKFTPVPED